MQISILLADAVQIERVCQVLTASGHQCSSFKTGKEILHHLRRETCELLVIDWQTPDSSGAEVLHWVRSNLPAQLPVLLLTNCSMDNDIVAGLDAGADDYLIKPIRKGELAMRVQNLLRRTYPRQEAIEQIRFGHYAFEVESGRVTLGDARIDVTQKEFDLALLLFRNLGRPLSRAYILETVWAHDFDGSSRTLDTHVSRLRDKLQLCAERGFRLLPVYSYGYRLEQVAA
jgi:DNA-binding response OmpR family regulator